MMMSCLVGNGASLGSGGMMGSWRGEERGEGRGGSRMVGRRD